MPPTGQGDFQVYAGNLDPNVNNQMLFTHFKKKFPSLFEAKVINDPVTRVSKGFGFLRFYNQLEAQSTIDQA